MIVQSGEKEHFSTGAQRDSHDGKPRPDLISPFAKERIGWVNKDGADHYGERNYEAGMPFSRVVASLDRHYMGYMQGDKKEDHLAQMVWNGCALLHYEELIKRGLLPAALDDLPRYLERSPAGLAAYFASLPKPATSDTAAKSETPYDLRLMQAIGISDRIAKQIRSGITYPVTVPTTLRYVYIAGPMRGIASFNFPAFDKARDAFRQNGYHVISPADIDRAEGDENSDNQVLFCLRDFSALHFIRSICDLGFVAMLPGWEKSVGATAEFMIGRWLGITVLDARTMNPLNPQDINTMDLLDSIRRFLFGQIDPKAAL